jgi:hypothetical protein
MSNYKKLGGKKLSPVRRSSVAMAHSLRGGAGAGLHRDKSKYTRKSKHKKRLNPGPPAGMPEAKWLSSINTMKEDIRANLGAAIKKAQEKHGIFTKTRPNGEKYEDSSPWPIAQGRLGLIMASSPHAALAEDALIFEDSGEVRPAANIVNSIMSPVFGDALKDEEVRDLYDMGVSALTEKIDMLRAPAIEVITSGEAALEEDEAEEDEEMLKARLIAKAKAAGEEELAEGIKRGLIEIEDAEEMLAGVEEEEVAGGEPEVKTEPTPQKSGARAPPRTPRTETQQKRGQERAERSASSLRVGKEKQTIPDEPTRARGVPLELERFIVHRRDIAAGPSADILNRVRSDVLLWALDNGHTQVWAKGSCIATFEASGSGKSSPQIAAQYAAEWRRGKKSRYSARIWVGVQGNSDIVMKADSLEAAARKAAPVGTPEQVAESIKVNPRYRHNAKMERVWGGVRFNVGYLSADALRRTARREREAEELALLEAESAMREADRRRQRGLTRKIKPVLSRAYLEAKGMPRRNPAEYPGITLIWRPTPGMQGESKFFPAYTDIRESVVMAEYREAAEAALKTVRANKHFPEIEVTLASGLAIKKDLPWLEQSAKYGVRSTVQASQTTSAIRKAVGLRENPKASLPSISGRMPKPHKVSLPSIYIPVTAPKKRKK